MAMASGVLTYSYKVMKTVGSSIISLLLSLLLLLFFLLHLFCSLFSSQNLESFLASHGLPTIPLVPVSSAQAVVGALIGIGLLQGGRSIKFGQLGRIASGWVTAPIVACFICFISLYIFQNVFSQKVTRILDTT
jgi:PiT family inorganic phosphate transporter